MTGSAVQARPRIDPRIGRRRAAVKRARGRRRLWVVVGALAVLAVATGAEAVLHSRLLTARHVSVYGVGHTPLPTVLRTAGLSGRPPMIDVDPSTVTARLDALPWVESASVSRLWPDRVVIHIIERAALVSLSRPKGGIALVDRHGRVLEWASASPAGLPLMTAPGPLPVPGGELSSAAQPGLAALWQAKGVLTRAVEGVTVSRGGAVTFDLGGGVTALIGNVQNFVPEILALQSLLIGAPPKGPEVIDVRVPGEPTVAPAGNPPA